MTAPAPKADEYRAFARLLPRSQYSHEGAPRYLSGASIGLTLLLTEGAALPRVASFAAFSPIRAGLTCRSRCSKDPPPVDSVTEERAAVHRKTRGHLTLLAVLLNLAAAAWAVASSAFQSSGGWPRFSIRRKT